MKEKTMYPLGMSQQLMLFSAKYSTKKQCVNICARIDINSEIDEQLMFQALYLAMMRIPANTTRLHKVGKETMQYFSDEAPKDICILDMTESTDEEVSTEMSKWSSKPFPNGSLDVQLYRVNLIQLRGGKHALYFCVNHLIFDAYSLMGCVKYALEIYQALKNSTPLPEMCSSPIDLYNEEYEFQKSEKYQKTIDWWSKNLEIEPQFTTVNGKGSPEWKQGKRYGKERKLFSPNSKIVDYVIPAELVNEVNRYATEHSISPQTLYLLAVRSYLGEVCDTDDVTIANAVARRAKASQKMAGGTMVNALTLRTIIGKEISFAEANMEMFKRQMDIYRRPNINFFDTSKILKKFNPPINCGYLSVSVTYQPYFDVGDADIDFSFRRISNGAASIALYMSIMPYDRSGNLLIDYEYLVCMVKPESISKLHNFVLRFLEEGMKSPEKTIQEISKNAINSRIDIVKL